MAGTVAKDEALKNSDSATNLSWLINNYEQKAAGKLGDSPTSRVMVKPGAGYSFSEIKLNMDERQEVSRDRSPARLPRLVCHVIATFDLARELISRVPLRPTTRGCQEVLRQRLAQARLQAPSRCASATSTISGPGAAPRRRSSASPAIPTWFRPARSTSGSPIRSRRTCATASSTAAAPPT